MEFLFCQQYDNDGRSWKTHHAQERQTRGDFVQEATDDGQQRYAQAHRDSGIHALRRWDMNGLQIFEDKADKSEMRDAEWHGVKNLGNHKNPNWRKQKD